MVTHGSKGALLLEDGKEAWAEAQAVELLGAIAAWAPQVMYSVGDEVLYQGVRYRAIQAHQSQPGWEPPNVPALWAQVQ